MLLTADTRFNRRQVAPPRLTSNCLHSERVMNTVNSLSNESGAQHFYGDGLFSGVGVRKSPGFLRRFSQFSHLSSAHSSILQSYSQTAFSDGTSWMTCTLIQRQNRSIGRVLFFVLSNILLPLRSASEYSPMGKRVSVLIFSISLRMI
jgi:hypothetical protein